MKKNFWIGLFLVTSLIMAACQNKNQEGETSGIPKPEFVGGQTCIECHEDSYKEWIGSHHEQAMKLANDSSVLGDFNNATFTHFGITYKFYKKNGSFYVSAEGKDGQMQEYKVLYTFGFTPLQQYIVDVDGRQQMLPTCWGADPKKNEEDHWFHIYPDEKIAHNDMLHWTGNMQNWNYMCAECHSTKLRKNFDLPTNTFNTSWSEINVSCESCHGPSSNHNLWASDSIKYPFQNMGLVYTLHEDSVVWNWDMEKGSSYRAEPRTDYTQIEMCARCHSRRGQITGDYVWGEPLAQTHRVQLLNDPFYYPDGQILDEDYVYASFLQSKMYHQGVTCTNCHDPHTTKVKTLTNALCLQCHSYEKYDSPKHHFHQKDSTGGNCMDCHMPTTNYMVTDPRRDHSMRNPRPDMSIELGVPNACNQCHTDKTNEWSLKHMKEWYGEDWIKPHYGHTMHRVNQNDPAVLDELMQLIADQSKPNIVRATALGELRRFPLSQEFIAQTIFKYKTNPNELIRREAASLLQLIAPKDRFAIGKAFLSDKIRSVRLEAGTWLVNVDPTTAPETERELFKQGVDEYIKSLEFNNDRGESHMNFAQMDIFKGDLDAAEKKFETAVRIDPTSVFIYLNWADLYRIKKDEVTLREKLDKAIELQANFAPAHLAMGLSYIREKKIDAAIASFKTAYKHATDAHTGYVYAVALFSNGKQNEGLEILEDVHKKHPYDLEIIQGVISFAQSMNDTEKAELFRKKLTDIQKYLK